MQKTASVSHFLFEGALSNSALLLLYFDFCLGERARCVRRSSSMSSRSRSSRSATPAKSKGDEASPFPDLGFAPSFMFAPPIIGRYVPLPYGPNEKPPTR